jgi:MFS superfamily sulfate permease-like transporter
MDKQTAQRGLLDQVAVALSGLCLLHCLLLPFLIAVLPFLGQFSDDHLHAEMLIVVVPVSVIALALGFRRHRHTGVVVSGIVGLALLIIGGTVAHSAYGLLADRALTVVGSITLAITHYRNFRLSKAAPRSAS